jgi:glycosyltransferase involved in cell wall biosynthesis
MESGKRPARLPEFVGVVIPARDEAETVADAVHSVLDAAEHPLLAGVRILVVVVDDSSSDSTGERADSALEGRGVVLTSRRGSAGGARELGFSELCRSSAGLAGDRAWFATTDADSRVSPSWLARQLGWWRRGADGVAGIVEPFGWAEQPVLVRSRYAAFVAARGQAFGHPHIYGANLGLTRAAYLAAGDIGMLDSGEDHALWGALVRQGRFAVNVPDVVVATSARRESRAPNGFSTLLRTLGEQTE